jgi:hypothetical protein
MGFKAMPASESGMVMARSKVMRPRPISQSLKYSKLSSEHQPPKIRIAAPRNPQVKARSQAWSRKAWKATMPSSASAASQPSR